jgi:hypothetical protein
VSEGGGRGWISQVISWHIDGLQVMTKSDSRINSKCPEVSGFQTRDQEVNYETSNIY